MKRVLMDISVVLDLLLNRSPWAADVAVIWDGHRQGQVQVHLAAFSLPTIFYIVRRQGGLTAARTAVQACLSTLEVLPVDRATLEDADALPGSDFEDNLQIACAARAALDAIITRDPKGFSSSPIPAITSADLRSQISAAPGP